MGCAYMLSRGATSYIIHGGDKEWLKKGALPEHVQSLFKTIRKCCKAPWEVTLDDFK